jgi:hypothetical protein
MPPATLTAARRISRHMPKVQRKVRGPRAWLLAGVVTLWLCGCAYALWMATPWVKAAAVAAVVRIAISSMTHTRKAKRKLSALAAQRAGESICSFARSFDTRTVDTWVLRAVYEQLQAELDHLHPHFPLRASDDLLQDLLLDSDDLDMSLAPDIAQRTGRCLDDTCANPYFGKVRRVSDLVGFFNAEARVNAA